MEANNLLNEESDEKEIIIKMKNVKEFTPGKDQVRMVYIKESGDEMKKEMVRDGSIYLPTERSDGRNH